MKKSFTILLFLCGSLATYAQYSPILFYADAMINATEVNNRIFASDKFLELFKSTLNKENSFNDKMSENVWISKIYAPDSTFRIFTWQIKVFEDNHISYGFIQFDNGKVIELNDTEDDSVDNLYTSLDPNEWIGAIYYDLLPSMTDSDSYLLFGFSGFKQFENLKILEVLQIKENQTISFGKEIFIDATDTIRADKKYRLILKFSEDTYTSISYNPSLKMIIHDHLITRMGTIPGQGITSFPDGSYVGYQANEDGKWYYVDKIFDQISEVAPRPNPVLGNKSKTDIFGKKKKAKKRRKK